MISGLSYGASSPSLDMLSRGYGGKKPASDPVSIGLLWDVKIDKTAPKEQLKRSLLAHALEQAEKGYESFSDELLNLAASLEK